MSIAAVGFGRVSPQGPHPATRPNGRVRAPMLARLERGMLWLVGFSSGFVLIEPAPYEFVAGVAFVLFFATGLRLRAVHVPLLMLLILCCSGYLIGVTQVLMLPGTIAWAATSCYMALTVLFFALAMGSDTEARLNSLMKGYVAVAVIASIFGILTYFHLLPGSDSFIFADRSKSTFKDPNVLGPFLVLPTVLAVQKMIMGRAREVLAGALIMLVLAIELLLAFSRGAWGAVGLAIVLVLGHALLTTRSSLQRLRILMFIVVGGAVIALVIGAILTLPQVSGLFSERAALIQSYDAGRFGRFGRHILALQLVLDYPIGIGPLQFTKFFPEDPHNSLLDAYMAGGWLSGSAYFALILATLLVGLRRPPGSAALRSTHTALYATFVALTAESYVIDVEHWRHYFLIMGLLWGLVGAQQRIAAIAGESGAVRLRSGADYCPNATTGARQALRNTGAAAIFRGRR
jgi:hypothetical protein